MFLKMFLLLADVLQSEIDLLKNLNVRPYDVTSRIV